MPRAATNKMRVFISLSLDPQAQVRFAAGGAFAILQAERAAVGFGDLPAQDQANAGAAGFGSVEGNEEIGRVRKSRSVVLDENIEIAAGSLPSDANAAAGFK